MYIIGSRVCSNTGDLESWQEYQMSEPENGRAPASYRSEWPGGELTRPRPTTLAASAAASSGNGSALSLPLAVLDEQSARTRTTMNTPMQPDPNAARGAGGASVASHDQ